MKIIDCYLIQDSKIFLEDSTNLAKDFCKKCDLIPTSVDLLNCKKMQFKFEDFWNDDWIMIVLTNLFDGFGGVEVYWNIFNGPISIY